MDQIVLNRRSRRLGGTPAAFGLAGVFWLAAAHAVLGGLHEAPLLVGLAIGYLVIATAALTALPDRLVAALIGLWVLAIALFAVYFNRAELAEGVLFTAYVSTVFATLTFAMWALMGLGFRQLLHRRTATGHR